MARPDPVDWLFSLERLGMKFGLENIEALCQALGHPERAYPSVIIAGTNGKGSVTAMLATALVAAGYRAARYTSPHLVRLEERYVIEGREVPPDALRDAAGRVRAAAAALEASGRLTAPPTFFESTTAVAFDLFREARVDLAVLEVGLGGRLDATNVVTPLVAAITSIAFDHEAQLGHTLASIAREKGGVIKPGVPVVLGPLPSEARAEIEAIAARQGAPVISAADTAGLQIAEAAEAVTVDLRTPRRHLRGVRLALRGRHQADNAAVAVAVLDVLERQGWRISDEALLAGLTETAWPARLEDFRHGGRDVLVDAAHNPSGAEALARHLVERRWRDVTLVFGAMEDKAVAGMLDPLLPLCARLVCVTAMSPRAMPADALAALARTRPGCPAEVAAVESPADALRIAVRAEAPVVVAGSIFLAGPVRAILR